MKISFPFSANTTAETTTYEDMTTNMETTSTNQQSQNIGDDVAAYQCYPRSQNANNILLKVVSTIAANWSKYAIAADSKLTCTFICLRISKCIAITYETENENCNIFVT